MEDVLVFHPGPGFCRHEGKSFTAVVSHQGDTCHGKSRIPFVHAVKMQGVVSQLPAQPLTCIPSHQLQVHMAKCNRIPQMLTVKTPAFLAGEQLAIDIRLSLHMLLEFILPDIGLLEN